MKKTNSRKFLAACTAIVMTMGMLSSCGSGGNSESYSVKSDSNEYYTENNNTKYQLAETDDFEENTIMGEMEIEMGNNEEYAQVEKNDYKLVSEYPLSTFSTDVDTASYTNVRRMINDGEEINTDAVRVEEFINYFKYDYPQPDSEAVGITTDLTDCPWNSEAKLMLVGMQAKAVETKDIPMNLVFLIDVSGSMMDDNKLPLVQQAFSMLAENLGEEDRISIVTYAGEEKVVLEGASGSNPSKIIDAINQLEAGGSTAGEAGINKAYELAEANFIEGGNNRVILATDGDLNVGVSSTEELTALVEEKRETGIALSVLGFGSGNLKDDRLEALADNGNGNYSYIDSLEEAERVLVTEMSGTLFTVAKDAKIQVEFNPANVYSYKLIGYENRALADEDFNDDTKDAGDIGAGQQVTALYEIILADGTNMTDSDIALKY
ncbi:MAG: VWA domain-containing protein, partial [Hominimerdicola sp.]